MLVGFASDHTGASLKYEIIDPGDKLLVRRIGRAVSYLGKFRNVYGGIELMSKERLINIHEEEDK